MGQALVTCAKENPALELVGTIDAGESLDPISSCDAVIDFTHADATVPALEKCTELGKIIVIGTTGHSNEVRNKITEASGKIPVIFSIPTSRNACSNPWRDPYIPWSERNVKKNVSNPVKPAAAS